MSVKKMTIRPIFVFIRHIFVPFIPEICRDCQYAVPLQPQVLKFYDYDTKNDYWNPVDCGWSVEAGQPVGYHRERLAVVSALDHLGCPCLIALRGRCYDCKQLSSRP